MLRRARVRHGPPPPRRPKRTLVRVPARRRGPARRRRLHGRVVLWRVLDAAVLQRRLEFGQLSAPRRRPRLQLAAKRRERPHNPRRRPRAARVDGPGLRQRRGALRLPGHFGPVVAMARLVLWPQGYGHVQHRLLKWPLGPVVRRRRLRRRRRAAAGRVRRAARPEHFCGERCRRAHFAPRCAPSRPHVHGRRRPARRRLRENFRARSHRPLVRARPRSVT
mmetsp:Transcript_28580/g.98307  ORF Transcript_28580/g.98307 Transcript_28580/m.98307 type:complete len:221 (-) Transcript_28580:2-664(-)